MRITTRAVFQMTEAGLVELERDSYEYGGAIAEAKGGGGGGVTSTPADPNFQKSPIQDQNTTPGAPGFNPGPFYFGPSNENPSGVPGESLTGFASPETRQLEQLQKLMTMMQDPVQRGTLATQLGQTAPAPTDEMLAQFDEIYRANQPTAAEPTATATTPMVASKKQNLFGGGS